MTIRTIFVVLAVLLALMGRLMWPAEPGIHMHCTADKSFCAPHAGAIL